ncbi:MAG TPA: sulfite oxidase [Micromonosporaceae bacterium]|nr:sulfite oxidase [Micromonosporaceae bacterium]
MAAAAVALGVGEVAGLLFAPRASPLVAVGGVVIDVVPESGKELAIRLFGIYDKIALQVGTVVILLAIAGLVGVLSLRRLWIGLATIAAFGLIGIVAALTRAEATAVWALPSLLGAAAAGATLWLAIRHLQDSVEEITEPAHPMGTSERRHFLQAMAAVIGGAAVVGYGGRAFGQRGAIEVARSAVRLPTPSGATVPAPPGADVAGLSYVTPNDRFYRIDTAIVVPRVDPATWTLTIRGRVRRPIRLTFDDLLKRPMIERFVTLACVSNEVGGDLVGNAKWLGVPVKDLLEEAMPDPGADQVVSRSVDGFTAGTPTEVLLDGRDAMLAIGMNGEPLPVEHGFPVRMVVPGLYGYVSATKWLAELELSTFDDFDAYWVPRGWAPRAPIKTQSRIDRPRDGATVPAGDVVVAGVAWAPHRGISAVEVRVDEGPWQPATLGTVASVDTWRLWSWTWAATPGEHILAVRATDGTGQAQTSEKAPPAPDGATGWHRIAVTVR